MEDRVKNFVASHKEQLILFNFLDEEEVEKILPYFDVVKYQKGKIIFNEGDEGDYIGIILSGILEVKKQTEFKGRQVIIASHREGSCVGEMALANENKPRSATVAASENSELIILSRDSLDSLIDQFPSTGVKILKGLNQVLAIRLRKAAERLAKIF
jgi:CRP-like cAMP-binding protein